MGESFHLQRVEPDQFHFRNASEVPRVSFRTVMPSIRGRVAPGVTVYANGIGITDGALVDLDAATMLALVVSGHVEIMAR